MNQYAVMYGGAPGGKRPMTAENSRDAARAYFARCMYRNSIIVRGSLGAEEVFSWRDFAPSIPDFDESRLLYLQPPPQKSGPRTFWDDVISHWFRNLFRNRR